MSNIFETVIEKIFGGTNFNKMMVVLAIEGVTYLFTKDWSGWAILNAIIFFIVGYCMLLFIVWLYKKLKPSEFRSFQKKQNKEWERSVLSFFYSLPKDIQDALLLAYTNMDKDRVYSNQRNSADRECIYLCQKLSKVDFEVPREGLTGQYLKNCIYIYEKNGVATIIFDPIICKELDKLTSSSVAKENKNK